MQGQYNIRPHKLQILMKILFSLRHFAELVQSICLALIFVPRPRWSRHYILLPVTAAASSQANQATKMVSFGIDIRGMQPPFNGFCSVWTSINIKTEKLGWLLSDLLSNKHQASKSIYKQTGLFLPIYISWKDALGQHNSLFGVTGDIDALRTPWLSALNHCLLLRVWLFACR